jgi:serine/threonine-protein kinase PRP4
LDTFAVWVTLPVWNVLCPGAPITRLVQVHKSTRDLSSLLMKSKAPADDRQLVVKLADLLEKMFTLDPAKRITVKEALQHPFVSSGHGR